MNLEPYDYFVITRGCEVPRDPNPMTMMFADPYAPPPEQKPRYDHSAWGLLFQCMEADGHLCAAVCVAVTNGRPREHLGQRFMLDLSEIEIATVGKRFAMTLIGTQDKEPERQQPQYQPFGGGFYCIPRP